MEQGQTNSQDRSIVPSPWALGVDEALKLFMVSRASGLDKHDVGVHLKKYGGNRLRQTEKKGVGQMRKQLGRK